MHFVTVARALRCKGISSFIKTAKLMGLHSVGWLSAAKRRLRGCIWSATSLLVVIEGEMLKWKIKECYYWPNYKEVEEKVVFAAATELGVLELVSSLQ